MNLFGCKFNKMEEFEGPNGEKYKVEVFPRKNFDSLLWATVTVFQVGTTQYCHPHVIHLNSS